MDSCKNCEHWQKVGRKNSKKGQCKNKNSFFYNLYLHADCLKMHTSGCYAEDLYRGCLNACPIKILGR